MRLMATITSRSPGLPTPPSQRPQSLTALLLSFFPGRPFGAEIRPIFEQRRSVEMGALAQRRASHIEGPTLSRMETFGMAEGSLPGCVASNCSASFE